jgi:Leucine-rich repeat (LRR) protein
VNAFRCIALVLMVVLPAGCGGPPAPSKSSKDTGPRATVAIPTQDKQNKQNSQDKHGTVQSNTPPTLESLLKEAPNVPLEKIPVSIGKTALTIEMPKGAAPEKSGGWKLVKGDEGLAIQPWSSELRNFEHIKNSWATRTGPGKGKILLDSPETLVVEADRPDDARYYFVTKVTTGNLDLGVTYARPGNLHPVLGTRSDVLLMLKCARTLTSKDPPPSDPAKALEQLGAVVEQTGGKVTTVHLRDTHGTHSTLVLLAKLPTVRDADLSWLEAEGADLAPLAALTQLESVTFAHTPVRDEGLKTVGKLANLRSLDLEKTRITAEGLQHLAGLKQLRKLKLDNNDLSGPGTANLPALPALEELSLYSAGVGDEGLKAVGQLKSLKVLNLEKCPLTDAGLVHLTGLANLEVLDLYGTRITAAGLDQVEKLKHLKRLNLKKTRVDAAGVARLKKALPMTDVRSDF